MEEIDKIIIRFLERTASEEEVLYLDKWIKDKENYRFFRQIAELWEKSQEDYSLFDKERAYNRLSVELNLRTRNLDKETRQVNNISDNLENPNKGRRLLLNVMKYVAAILFPVVLFLILFNSKEEIPESLADVSIVPGGSRAVLLMSDGAKVNLANDSLHIQDTTTGVTISNNRKHIEYKGAHNNIVTGKKEKLKYNTIAVGRGGEYQLILSDGTKVWLNSESKLRYPVAFGGDVRNVELEGEAYFSVSKDIKRPFKVKTEYGTVKVLGTSFNVMAYKNEDVFQATLVSGAVQLTEKSGNSVKLKPGQQGIILKGDKKIKVREVDTDYYCSWTNDELLFENVTLDELMIKLGRWYDFEVFYQNKELRNLRFSGGIDKFADIENTIRLIEETNKVKISIKKKIIIVRDR